MKQRLKLLTMRYLFVFAIMILFSSCNKPVEKPALELIAENDTIMNKGIGDTCINILRFSIHNNSDKTYYINNLCSHNLKSSKKIGIFSNFISMNIYNQDGQEIEYNFSHFKGDENAECAFYDFMNTAHLYEKSLGYNYNLDYYRNAGFKNFFIHPDEVVYFEHPIDLSGSVGLEIARIGYADLDRSKKYYATISFASDSSTYKSSLPRDILKTIKANDAEVFSGRLESAKIPIKFVK